MATMMALTDIRGAVRRCEQNPERIEDADRRVADRADDQAARLHFLHVDKSAAS